MVRILAGVGRRRSFLQLLVVLIVSVLIAVIGSFPGDEVHKAQAIGILSIPLVTCVAGFILRWSPILPCMFLGMATSIFRPAINRPSYSVYSDLLGGGLCGVFVGFLIALGTYEEFRPERTESEREAENDQPPRVSTPPEPLDG